VSVDDAILIFGDSEFSWTLFFGLISVPGKLWPFDQKFSRRCMLTAPAFCTLRFWLLFQDSDLVSTQIHLLRQIPGA